MVTTKEDSTVRSKPYRNRVPAGTNHTAVEKFLFRRFSDSAEQLKPNTPWQTFKGIENQTTCLPLK